MDRRTFCLGSGSLLASTMFEPSASGRADGVLKRRKIAALCSEYRTKSHAQHIVDRFLQGYPYQGEFHEPPFEVAGIYMDQLPDNDLSRERSRTYNIRFCKDPAEALTLGTGTLAVDGVLSIFEHGRYPRNEKGQHLLPRWEHFQKIVEVFEKSGRAVPVFNDKHLSYDWEKAKWMVAKSRQIGFPLMAGSSLPVTWRLPALEFPIGAEIEEVLCTARGRIDSYDFHALETIQCMVERRKGGETGLKSIQCLEGEAVWEAMRRRAWSPELLQAALSRSDTRKAMKEGYLLTSPAEERLEQLVARPVAYLLEYRDGLKGTMLLLNGLAEEFNFAARLKGGRVESCQFYLPYQGHVNFFSPLVYQVERMFETGMATWPIERTLLTTGMVSFAVESRHLGHVKLETPELAISYSPPRESFFYRE